MITENLSTLKIHNLTKEQYERELAAGRIDENALYLTPYEETDLSPYATTEQVNSAIEQVRAEITEHTHKWSDIEDPICGESFGDTLTWDGNREGRTESPSVALYPSYKCSDAVVTLEDIANGLSYTLSDGCTRTLEPNVMSTWMALDSFIHEHFAVVNNEYAAELGYEPGIFLTGYEDAEGKYIYVKSLTIPGYTGFSSITKLDAKFLPDDVATKNEIPYIPIPTQLDDNKFLRVVNGVPAWVSIPYAEEATF